MLLGTFFEIQRETWTLLACKLSKHGNCCIRQKHSAAASVLELRCCALEGCMVK
jgi:hypothetical protein